MQTLSSILSFFGSDAAEQIIFITMMCFAAISSGFLSTVLILGYLKNKKIRAIKKQIVKENSIDLPYLSEIRKNELQNPRVQIVNLGASNLVNSTDCEALVTSIDLLDKDQYGFILLCCWGKQ